GWRALQRRATRGLAATGAMNGSQRRIYKDLLALMSRRGYPKPAWLPPLRHLRDVAPKDPTFAAQAGPVVDLLYRSRSGGGGRSDLDTARACVASLRRNGR